MVKGSPLFFLWVGLYLHTPKTRLTSGGLSLGALSSETWEHADAIWKKPDDDWCIRDYNVQMMNWIFSLFGLMFLKSWVPSISLYAFAIINHQENNQLLRYAESVSINLVLYFLFTKLVSADRLYIKCTVTLGLVFPKEMNYTHNLPWHNLINWSLWYADQREVFLL